MLDALRSLGLSNDQIVRIGGELTAQLRNEGEDDLTDLLMILDVRSFVQKIDWHEVAGHVEIDAKMARSVAALLAPAVQAFSGDRRTTRGRGVENNTDRYR